MIPVRPGSVRLYIAEEQEFFREIYRASFESDTAFCFLGASSNGDLAALKIILASEKPDVLLMGVKKLEANALQELEYVCSEHPEIRPVVLVTSLGPDETRAVRRLIQKCRGGIGIYLKQSLDNGRQLHDIIYSVSRGQVILDPQVANSVCAERADSTSLKQLTEREMEILNLLSLGYTNQGIAKTLCIDVKTVAHHLNNIYGKLKENSDLDQLHPRVGVARLYLENTGRLISVNPRTSVPVYPES